MPQTNSMGNLELLSRLSSVAEELEDISKITGREDPTGKQLLAHPNLRPVKTLAWVPSSLFAELSKWMLLRNLSCGRSLTEVYAVGKYLGLSLKVKSKQELVDLLKQAGLEVLALTGLKEQKISVMIRRGISAKEVGRSKHPVCYFEAGLLAGAIEKLVRRKTDLRECQCAATHPSGNCRFVDQDYLLAAGDHLPSMASLSILPLDQYSEENVRLLTSLATHALTAIENTLLYERTKRQTVIDNLTGVYNHRYFQQSLRIELKKTERHRQPLSLLMIDVDNFKEINDRYGHLRGDRVLKLVARIFVRSVREIDIVARYGGDEFAIILPQTDLEGAGVVARRILKAFHGPILFYHEGRGVPIGVSLGIADKQIKDKEVEPLIRAADNALLKAKKKGGRQMVVAE